MTPASGTPSAPSVTAFAPGGIGNVGPGLDILGLAVAGIGDTVTARWHDEPGIHVMEPGHPDLPRDAARHTAALAGRAVMTRLGAEERGIGLWVKKGLALSGGQGGSAASAVAGAVAVNALLGDRLTKDQLLEACLAAEAAVAGRHADNVAPQLLGGIVLVRSLDPLDIIPLPVPPALHLVLAHPDQRLRTAEARAALPAEVSRAVALHQAAQVGAFVAALVTGDLALLGRAIDDRIAEPARAALLPGFAEAKRAALEAGALGSSISGAGPTAFALTSSRGTAVQVASAMQAAYAAAGVACTTQVTEVDRAGARIVSRRGADGQEPSPDNQERAADG